MTGEPRDFTFQDPKYPKLSGSPVKSYDSGWDWIGMIGLFQLSRWLSMSPLGHHMSPCLGTKILPLPLEDDTSGGFACCNECQRGMLGRRQWVTWASARCQRDICFGGLATGDWRFSAAVWAFGTRSLSRFAACGDLDWRWVTGLCGNLREWLNCGLSQFIHIFMPPFSNSSSWGVVYDWLC